MRNLYFYLFTFLLVAALTGANAQEMLSLQDCKLKALEHNQTLKSAQADLKSGKAQLKLCQRAWLPTVDLSSTYTYLNDPNLMVIPGYELPTITGQPSGVYSPASTKNLAYNHSYRAALGVSLPLYLGGKLRNAQKLSSLAMQMAETNVVLQQADLLLSIEKQYWGIVSLQEQKKVIRISIDFLKDVVKEVNNFFETGILTKNDVLKAQVELNNAQLALMEISNNLELAKMRLNQSMGHGILTPIVVSDSVIIVSPDLSNITFKNDYLAQRPEVKLLNNQVELFKTQKKMVNADYMPQLVSYASYVAQNPNHLANQENELTFNAGVSLSIPVFHWGEKRLKNVSQQMTIQKAENSLEQNREYVVLDIQQSIFRLKESLTKLNFTQVSFEQAEENLQLETNQLMEGISTTRELLNAQLQWQQSYADYINAKNAVKINEASYYKSIGQLQM